MADYDDKSYYEIQLEQKQLVLILMLMVAICVLFFFLGVYYVKGREPIQASIPKAVSTPTPTPDATPEKVETETVARFFEPGDGKGAAKKEEFEGKVLAESLPADPIAKPPKGEGKEKPSPAPRDPPKEAVKTPAPTKVAPPEVDAPPRDPSGSFVVQIAAVTDEDRARKVMSEIKSLGFPAYLKTEEAGSARYKIRVGPYAQREKADQARDGLRSQGYPGAFVSSD